MDDLAKAKELLQRAQPFLEGMLKTHAGEQGEDGDMSKLSHVVDEVKKFLMKAQEHP